MDFGPSPAPSTWSGRSRRRRSRTASQVRRICKRSSLGGAPVVTARSHQRPGERRAPPPARQRPLGHREPRACTGSAMSPTTQTGHRSAPAPTRASSPPYGTSRSASSVKPPHAPSASPPQPDSSPASPMPSSTSSASPPDFAHDRGIPFGRTIRWSSSALLPGSASRSATTRTSRRATSGSAPSSTGALRSWPGHMASRIATKCGGPCTGQATECGGHQILSGHASPSGRRASTSRQ